MNDKEIKKSLVKVNCDVEAHIENILIIADSKVDLFEKLGEYTFKELIEAGYVTDFSLNNINYEANPKFEILE